MLGAGQWPPVKRQDRYRSRDAVLHCARLHISLRVRSLSAPHSDAALGITLHKVRLQKYATKC